METVISADGTPIAFERTGTGRPVVLVGGAFCDRGSTRSLARTLGGGLSVLGYDRRGRGDSGNGTGGNGTGGNGDGGNTRRRVVEREIEDLAAVVAEAGAGACVYGHSSGAALVLRAAAVGLSADRVVLHEPPFVPDGERDDSREFVARLTEILAQGRHSDAAELFLRRTGLPGHAVDGMMASPWWPTATAYAPTLAHECAVMGDGAVPAGLLGDVPMPVLVVSGGASPAWMTAAGARIAHDVPQGKHVVLDGQGHVVPEDVLGPVVAEFLGRE